MTATHSRHRAHREPDAPVVVPVLARLADYRGEADLIPLLRRALNQFGPWQLGDASVRLLLWASNLRFVLLLDGLNEIERAHVSAGRKALRGHLSDYRQHVVHLSCRTADFDAEGEAHPELQVLPGAELWTVQELVAAIAYWDDAGGESDVRDYLRFHLGEANGRRLYSQLRHDERQTSLVRLPLFLWMVKSEDEFVQAYARQVFGEQRRIPYYWNDSRFNRLNQPVGGVNWYEAMAYAAWLARVSGKAYRLPSKAEWEWAARRRAAPSFWP